VIARVDAWQRRHAVAAIPVAVLRKFLDDRASSLAALVAYYAFLSLFPLLLVFVSSLGFVLQGNPGLQDDVVDSALARIPVVGTQLSSDVDPLTGSALALSRAFAEIWDVPRADQRGTLHARVRGLAVLALLGGALIASTVVTNLALGGAVGPLFENVATLAAAIVFNALVCLALFGLLTVRPFDIGELLPGVLLAAAGGLVLQALGGVYVEHTVARATDTYGAFALVIGLLSWLWLGAHLLLIGAEVNVVRHARLWPRSLNGGLEPADRAALRRAALAARQDRREDITVRFRR